jgi:hypothetical protein
MYASSFSGWGAIVQAYDTPNGKRGQRSAGCGGPRMCSSHLGEANG